jgi:hypothetical protein
MNHFTETACPKKQTYNCRVEYETSTSPNTSLITRLKLNNLSLLHLGMVIFINMEVTDLSP